MEKEPLFDEKDLDKAIEIWKNVLIGCFALVGRDLSPKGVWLINRFLLVSGIAIATITKISIPITNIEIPAIFFILLGIFILIIITEFPVVFSFLGTIFGRLYSARDTKFKAIINKEKSEVAIRIILHNTKFTPAQYEKIIPSLIEQDKFPERTQLKFIRAIKKLNADIRPILKDSFINNNKFWSPRVVSSFLYNSKKRYQRDTKYLTDLLNCYPNTSVGITIGASQTPKIDDVLIKVGIALKNSKFRITKGILIFSLFMTSVFTIGYAWPPIQNYLISINERDLLGLASFVLLVSAIIVFYKIYMFIKERIVSLYMKSLTKGLVIDPIDLENIIDDFTRLI